MICVTAYGMRHMMGADAHVSVRACGMWHLVHVKYDMCERIWRMLCVDAYGMYMTVLRHIVPPPILYNLRQSLKLIRSLRLL